MKRLPYGMIGLLSLLGFIGIIAGEFKFICFFGFLVHLRYFFIDVDEMREAYMNRSAAFGFYAASFAMAITFILYFGIRDTSSSEALMMGLSLGWVTSIVVYSGMLAFFEFRESVGLNDD